MIRSYNKNDIKKIEELGSLLHPNYEFKLDLYSKCIVLEINDRIIGFLIYSIIYERAEIIDIIVDEIYRKKGYATMLLNATLDDCKLNNCNNVTLEVNVQNKAAIAFYKKNGFTIVAKREKYYNGIDGYLMEKKVR